MVLVKVCGITNLEDALVAIDAGADALGFNFFKPSPRYITPEAARSIIDRLPRTPDTLVTVGVFVNESLDQIRTVASTAGVSALQLHGDESPEYCKALTDYYLIKVFSAGERFAPAAILDYDVRAIMFDAVDKDRFGGTGQLSNWAVARQAGGLVPRLFLAGGLSPENVAEAIRQVKPYAVDACSKLERAPGVKDHERVRAFVAAVREVDWE
jgi:phosphoribosylanthranilate isomerase